MENPSNFYVQAYNNGGLESFEVLPMDGKFGIAKNGAVIAELREDEGWKQITRDILDPEVLESIIYEIEKRY